MSKRKRTPKPPLPPPCSRCRPFDGAWRKDAYSGAMERCECDRGKAIIALIYGRKRKRRTAQPKAKYDGRMASTGESE
jgi:hypothetical protein